MSHKGAGGPAGPCAAARGRQVRAGPRRTRRLPPPVSGRLRGERRRRGPSRSWLRTRRPSFVSRTPPGQAPGKGGARPGGSPHAARGLSREQSAAARSRRHVPRPRRAQPAPQEHGGGAAAPAETARPSRAALVASARPGSAPSRRRAQASRATRRPPSRLAHEGSCPRGRTQSPRGARVAPGAPSPRSSCVRRPLGRAQSLGDADSRPRRASRPPARRFLVGAPPPGPRPAPCAAAAALFWRRFNSRPREKLSPHRGRAPRLAPAAPGTATGLVRSLPRAIVCAGQAPPGFGPPPPRAPSGPRARQDGRPMPAPNGPRPTRPAAPAVPPAPPPLRLAHNRFP